MLGNPKTDSFIDSNAKVPLAHRLALISDALYKVILCSSIHVLLHFYLSKTSNIIIFEFDH